MNLVTKVIGGKKDKEQEITENEKKCVEIFSYYLNYFVKNFEKKNLKKSVS